MSRLAQPVIMVIAGDAGGASAVAPVVRLLRGGERYRVVALAYLQARAIWEQRAIFFEPLDETVTPDRVSLLLERSGARLLLTGTSANGVDLEKQFVVAARQMKIPSLAVLDLWSNYRLRFAAQDGTLAFLPDRIAVMDEQARDEMSADGFDPAMLTITGQPAFDGLAELRERFGPRERETTRATVGVAPDEFLVLFASQPVADFYGPNLASDGHPGFTEQTVLGAVVPALERIAGRTNRKLALLIRPHPREDVAGLLHWTRGDLHIVVSSQGDAREVALASDLVTGMSTILLMEACLLGCVVLSLQPGLKSADPLPTNRQGLSRAVYHETDVEANLYSLLFDEGVRAALRQRLDKSRWWHNSARRVVQLIDSMIDSNVLCEREREA
jgi:hypothetical protein